MMENAAEVALESWKYLNNPPVHAECIAINWIKLLQFSAALDTLRRFANHQKPIVKICATSALAYRRVVGQDGITYLKSKLIGDADDVVIVAVGLAHIGDSSGIDELREILESEQDEFWVYYQALEALVDLEDMDAINFALERVNEPEAGDDDLLREWAALLKIKPNPDAVQILHRFSLDSGCSDILRSVALRGLVRCKSELALPVCRDFIAQTTGKLRSQAIEGVAEIGPPELLPLLSDSFTSEESSAEKLALAGGIMRLLERTLGIEFVNRAIKT